MSKRSGFFPCPAVDTAGSNVVSQAGGLLLTETVRAVALAQALSDALACWRRPNARHDPAEIVLDLAVTLALGGDCLADIAVLRAEPALFGSVASDPTVSRTIDRLAAGPVTALRAINTARATARARAWELAGEHAPDHRIDAGDPLTVDVDATLVTAHTDKEGAAPTFKKGFGHHPLWAFVDHGGTGDNAGTGEPLSVLSRSGGEGVESGVIGFGAGSRASMAAMKVAPASGVSRPRMIRVPSSSQLQDKERRAAEFSGGCGGGAPPAPRSPRGRRCRTTRR